ncbi:MAG: hypothetical protein QNJ29_10285 [Rhizobiaceae bacterium]|nr:hypothetical protein [Rhizobiaceae bacterium]
MPTRCVVRNAFFCVVTIVLAASFLTVTPSTTHAQFTIEIGISRDKAVRAMLNNGYSQINVVRKGFKTVRAQACLNGKKYLVRVDDKYNVSNQQDLGFCRGTVTAKALEQNLINSGYERVVIERQNGQFIAIGCLNGTRTRITYSSQGEILRRRNIGQCREIFEPNDVRKVLRDAGYNRIRFLDRQLPWYRAEACQNNTKFELLLTRYGQIRRSDVIGQCAPELRARDLRAFLRNKGYSQIEIIDDRLPGYQVAACFNNDRFDLELSRYGDITSRQPIGKCRTRMNEDEIARLLRSEGFTRISVKRQNNGNFNVSACLDGYQKFAVLSRFGELVSERDGNRCQSQRISEIFQTLKEGGFRKNKIFSESCRRGRKIRIEYNFSGDEIGRQRIGGC